MLPENRVFLVRGDDGQEYGPVDLRELREWVQENRAGVGTAVCLDESGATWQPWQNYPELVALVAEVQGTGSGVTLADKVSTPIWRRILAWIVDVFLLYILFIPIVTVLQRFLPMEVISQCLINPAMLQNASAQTLQQVVGFEIFANGSIVLYLAGFYFAHGRTPAMKILGMRLVDQNGHKPALVKSILRAVVLVMSINMLFPLVYVFLNPQRRSFQDLIAGTYVVNE